MKRVARWTIHFVGVAMALIFGGALYQRVVSMHDYANVQPPGEMVDIGGRRLHLVCSGTGSPTVILEAGGLATYRSWSLVQAQLATTNRVCSYDRAGMGHSETGPTPRDTRHLADDLANLLRVAKVPPPYVLVGHSAGGLVVRLFAAEHPDEVKGLVLVDSAPAELAKELPRIHARMRSQLWRAQVLVRLGILRFANPLGLDHIDRTITYRAEVFDSAADLVAHFTDDAAQLAAAPPIPRDKPILVLTHSRPGDWAPDTLDDSIEAAWQAAQLRLAALSNKSRVIVVPDAGHMIPQEAPDAVVAAIREVAQSR